MHLTLSIDLILFVHIEWIKSYISSMSFFKMITSMHSISNCTMNKYIHHMPMSIFHDQMAHVCWALCPKISCYLLLFEIKVTFSTGMKSLHCFAVQKLNLFWHLSSDYQWYFVRWRKILKNQRWKVDDILRQSLICIPKSSSTPSFNTR